MIKEAIIKTNDLCKSYASKGNEQNVLNNINLEIYKNDFTIIMGSSGSGKSTLLYILSMMDNPTSGKVQLLNVDSDEADESTINTLRQNKISFIFQNFNLLPDMTAFENIAYPTYLKFDRKNADKKSRNLLKQLNMESEGEKYPSNMSGGQQQRIAIMRALVKEPEIIFADEPTGALNSQTSADVLDLMTKIHRNGQTIVMVTHDIKACLRGNRVIYLSDGEIIGDLDLGMYDESQKHMREEAVIKFLRKYNW